MSCYAVMFLLGDVVTELDSHPDHNKGHVLRHIPFIDPNCTTDNQPFDCTTFVWKS